MEVKTYYICWEKAAKDTANSILQEVTQDSSIQQISLKARGKLMNRAIDILEILKRELDIKHPVIETETEELVPSRGLGKTMENYESRKPVKVSCITINLQR